MGFVLQLLRFIDLVLLSVSHIFFRERKITGQIALVTGGAQGIGRYIAQELAKRGATVVILDVNKGQLDNMVAELQAGKHQVHGYVCDVSKEPEISSVVSKIIREVGPIDILVNNAGIIFAKPLIDMATSAIEKTIGVNLLAHFWTIRNILPEMKKRGKGIIVNVSSMAGIGGTPMLTAYAASKFGVIGLSESLRNELRCEKSPITVHVAMPFMIRTAMNNIFCPPAVKRNESMSNMTDPDECAKIIVEEALRGRFKIFVPHSNIIGAYLTALLPQPLLDIMGDHSGFMTLQAT